MLCLMLSGAGAPADLVFSGACDGSAAAMLPDGRLAVADDESASLRLYRPTGGRGEPRDVSAHVAAPGRAGPDFEPDIEAAARVGDRIYWIASHGRNGDAEVQPDRQLLFATRADGDLAPVGRARHDLLGAMIADRGLASLELGKLAARSLAPEAGGLNIEALAAGGDADTVLIGFRSPRAAGGANAPALVVPLRNAQQVVDGTARPLFGPAIALPLDGRGLRDMVRKADGSYLLIAGPTADGEDFALYRWAGRADVPPVRLPARLDGLHPEAIVDLGARTLLLSDDGDRIAPGSGRKCKSRKTPAAQRTFAGRLLD